MKTNQSLVALLAGALSLASIAPGQAFARTQGDIETEEENVAEAREPVVSVAVAVAVAVAISAIGDVAALANSSSVTGPGKLALAQSVAQASTYVGNALAISSSTAGSSAAVAHSLSQASSVLGNATAIATSSAVSGAGKPALAQSLAKASTVIGNATAVATSEAH
jgi:hypothetical protein